MGVGYVPQSDVEWSQAGPRSPIYIYLCFSEFRYFSYKVVMDSGVVKLTILKPQGYLTGINYGGMDNLLDVKSNETSRG